MRAVTFQLRHSELASAFNADRHDDTLTGDVMMTYDDQVVVRVTGWRFAHTVKRKHVAPAGRETRWHAYRTDEGNWLVKSPRQPDGKHLHHTYATGAEVLAALAGGRDRD